MVRRRSLLCLALAAAGPLGAQDYADDVAKACTSPRYGLRLAASRKVAAAGDAAVPAVVKFAEQNGKDRLPVALVEAFADQGGNGSGVLGLLEHWATDRDFYWRAQALRGLALRAPQLGEQRARVAELLQRYADDAAWLTRAYARLGLELLRERAADEPAVVPDDADPRAATRLAALLLQNGRMPPLQPLLDALVDYRTCLGDPWGRRRALEAFQALSRWLGEDGGYAPDADAAANAAAVGKLRELAAARSGQQLAAPEPQLDPDPALAGGIEVLSCRDGDLFVRWTAAGELAFGLTRGPALPLAADDWRALTAERTALRLAPQQGVVICDKLRVRWPEPDTHSVVAPGALPPAAADWLMHLAAAVERAGDPNHAAALRTARAQFAAR